MLADVTNGVRTWWAPLLAFAAGIVSFASPCVLPLVPGYLSFVTGGEEVGVGEGGATQERPPLIPILLFILGFSVVFTVLWGFGASALSRWLRSVSGQRAAGVVVIVFGLFMLLYAFRTRITWLYREGRPLLSRVKPGPAGAFPLGIAFGIGWTPCIGPVLGAIATLAATEHSTGRAVLLLFVYSMGLGIPFFLIGIGVRRLMTAFRFFSRNYRVFAGISGAIMVSIGVLLVIGVWTQWMAPLFRFANRLSLPI
jgi:cytochrome c-type biogenesis protein